MTDYTQYVTSEHCDKPIFMALMTVTSSALDGLVQSTLAIQAAYDLDGAVGSQQDTIGEWVGQARVVSAIIDPVFFGFQDDDAALPFGELINPGVGGRFYELNEGFSSSSTLGDPEYLTILKAKIVKNQYDGSLAGLENALQFVFGVPCAIVDNNTEDISIAIGRPITAIEKTLITTFDLLPRCAGSRILSVQYVNFINGVMQSSATVRGHL